MKITNTTKMTSQAVMNVMLKGGRFELIKKFYIPALLLVSGALLYGISFAYDTQKLLSTLGLALMVFSVVYCIMNLISIFRLPKTIKKKNADLLNSDITYVYTFKEHSVFVECLTNDKKKKVEYPYTEIKRITELDDRFEINLASYETLYINKDGFNNPKEIEIFVKNIKNSKKKIKNKTSKK